MQEITYDEFSELTKNITRSSVHLESRDAYGTETELPHMAKWAAGEPDDFEWLRSWCDKVRGHVAAGRTVRRAKIVSEPLSDYQRWAYDVTDPIVEAGEDIRWAPRRSVSTLCLPGNDYYLLDDELVVFLHYAGSGRHLGYTTTTDPAVAEMCRVAFENVWALSILHSEYKPH